MTRDLFLKIIIAPFLPAAAVGWAIGTLVGLAARHFDKAST